MNATNKLWGAIVLVLVLFAIYYSLFPLPAQIIFNRFFAVSGFFLLCISLMIGPLVVFSPKIFGQLLKARRDVGVIGALLILVHFIMVFVFSYSVNFSFLFSTIGVIFGLIALLILILLTITSADVVIRTMGFGKWKFVQRFVYLAFILSFLHFVLYTNGLFVPIQNGKIFVNLIEVGLILLGLLTILLQIGGFVKTIYLKSSKKEEAV